MSATARKIRLGDEYVEKPISYLDESGNPVFDEDAMREYAAKAKREIRIVKSHDIVPISRKEVLDKLLNDMESELGRLSKLLQQTRAEFLRASD